MTTWCDGVIYDIAAESVHGLAQRLGIRLPKSAPIIAGPTPASSQAVEVMWFDEFVRLPDYIAGVLAAWNFKKNEFPDEQEKFVVLAEQVIATARNMAILCIDHSETFRVSRRVFSVEPFEE